MSTVRLVSVYTERLASLFLYEILKERSEEPHINISHRELPPLHVHQEFVRSHPYRAWYLIEADVDRELQSAIVFGPTTTEATMDRAWVGAIYLTPKREVGIHLLRQFRGKGYADAAMKELRTLWPGPLLANINPANHRSIAFFSRYGARHIQNTYEL